MAWVHVRIAGSIWRICLTERKQFSSDFGINTVGLVSDKDRKILDQLVRDCILFGLNERESLEYIQKRSGGVKIARSTFYLIKKRISRQQSSLLEQQMNEHIRVGFALAHFKHIHSLEYVQKILFKTIDEEASKAPNEINLFGISRLATNILMNVQLSNLNLDLNAGTIQYVSIITSILFLVSLTFFGWLSVKSKSIRTFQSQISLFIGLYVIGELFEIKQLSTLLSIPDSLGSQIHVGATIFLTIIIWMRLYYSEKGIKSLADTETDTPPPDSGTKT